MQLTWISRLFRRDTEDIDRVEAEPDPVQREETTLSKSNLQDYMLNLGMSQKTIVIGTSLKE